MHVNPRLVILLCFYAAIILLMVFRVRPSALWRGTRKCAQIARTAVLALPGLLPRVASLTGMRRSRRFKLYQPLPTPGQDDTTSRPVDVEEDEELQLFRRFRADERSFGDVKEEMSTFFPDQPATRDDLDFQSYAETLASLIGSERTRTPLTVGIFGSWGSGKTTLMRMVEEQLGPNKFVLIRFDAWKYYKEEALWRALLLRVLDAIRSHLNSDTRSFAGASSHRPARSLLEDIERLEQGLYRDIDWEEKGGFTIDWPQLLKAGVGGALKLSFAFVPGLSTLTKAVEAAQGKVGEGKIAEDASALAEAFRRDVIKHHQVQLSHVEQFQREFARLVKNYLASRRVVIFVDDLDRCLPEKAIEVLEAMKIFLDVEGCVFVLGLDQQVIARGIETKYKDFANAQGIDSSVIGEHYVEKIIQLPFLLPPIEPVDMQSYLDSFNADWPSPGCSRIFAEGLPPNPRQVKRTVNVFMLLWKLAERRRRKVGNAVTPVRLAKVVALQTTHPRAFEYLKSNPAALKELEAYCQEPGNGSERITPAPQLSNTVLSDAARQEPVRRLFQAFFDNEDARFAELEVEELVPFFSLARRVPTLIVESGKPAGTVPATEDAAPSEPSVPKVRYDPRVVSPRSEQFVGRQAEVASLIEALRGIGPDGTAPRALITGMPGVGKTELALSVANSLHAYYTDGQLFIQFDYQSPSGSLVPVLAECIRACGGPEADPAADLDELARLLRISLNGKRTLMILDDVDDEAQVESLLPPEGCAQIITSGRVLSLKVALNVRLKPLEPEEARQLLLSTTSNVLPDEAEKIAHLCGFLPMAMRAAAYSLAEDPKLTPGKYIDQLNVVRQRLDQLSPKGVGEGIEESFNRSYLRLDREAARVLRLISTFHGNFDAKAEEAVCRDPNNAHLGALVSRNLVEYSHPIDRYRLHDVTWLFARKKLEELTEGYEPAKSHAEWYLNTIREANAFYLRGADGVKTGLALFDTEWPNIRAGLDWSQNNSKDNQEVAALCSDYSTYGIDLLELRVAPRTRLPWLNAAARAAWRFNDHRAEGGHMSNVGRAYHQMGENVRAVKFHGYALEILRSIGDDHFKAVVLGNLATCLIGLGETRRAIELCDSALAKLTDYGDRRNVTASLASKALACCMLGDRRAAIDLSKKSLKIALDIHDLHAETIALTSLAEALYRDGQLDDALETIDRASAVAGDIGDRCCKTTLYGILGEIHAQSGQLELAIQCFDNQLAVAEEVQDLRSQGRAYFNKALALYGIGEIDKALLNVLVSERQLASVQDPEAEKSKKVLDTWNEQAKKRKKRQ